MGQLCGRIDGTAGLGGQVRMAMLRGGGGSGLTHEGRGICERTLAVPTQCKVIRGQMGITAYSERGRWL